MKSKCSLFLALLLAGALFSQAQTSTEGNVKKFHQAWEASTVETLEIINKFGDIKVNNGSSNQVTVDVVVTVDDRNSSDAQKLLSDISVGFSKTGDVAKAETSIRENFRTKVKFSIDYSVNIPSDKNLTITNKFGNTFINELLAKGTFNIGYGNITANKLDGTGKGNVTLNLEYGKGDLGETGDATMNVSYSKLFLKKGKKLTLNTKYSGLKLGRTDEVVINSKYDGFEMEEVGSMTADMKYTSVNLSKLNKKFILSSGYGGIKVDEVASDFELIEITSSFGQISLGIDESASYKVKAECEFCEIEYPKEKFKGNSEKSDFTKKIDGSVGEGSMKGRVSVKSKYGKIELAR